MPVCRERPRKRYIGARNKGHLRQGTLPQVDHSKRDASRLRLAMCSVLVALSVKWSLIHHMRGISVYLMSVIGSD